MNHLTEETLNEYLDGELAPAARAAADGHLSACADCWARLEALRGLFVELEDLPDARLARDLATAVVAALEKRSSVPGAVRVVVILQVLAAAAILALAWPVLQLEQALSGLSVAFNPVFPAPSELTRRVVQQWAFWGRSLAQLGRPPAFAAPFSIHLDPPAILITLTLVSACLLWLVGNGLLLRPRAGSYKRRHS